MVCRTRAYYTAHPESFKPRRIPDMEDSEERGRVFVSKHLAPRVLELSKECAHSRVLQLIDCNEEKRAYYVAYEGLDRGLACKPDLVSIVLLRGGILRTLVFEVGDTDTGTVLRRKHVIPRILLYMLAAYIYHGIPPVGLYISLSPKSSPPALAIVSKSGRVGISRILREVSEIVSAPSTPEPLGKPACSHCVYAPTCRFTV
jgi:hypothetical protein